MTTAALSFIASLFAAPTPGPAPKPKVVAHLPCEITVESPKKVVPDGGAVAEVTGMPVRVEMKVHNSGATNVEGISSSFWIRRGRGEAAPLPKETIVHSLAAGTTFTRVFEIKHTHVDDDDRVYIEVRPDTADKYATGGRHNLPRVCRAKFDVVPEPK